jgi:tetratricopeptide (TPR) repeat protein
MDVEQRFERIEAYIANEMSDTERVSFESALESDSTLADEFRELELAYKLFEAEEEIGIKNKIRNIRSASGRQTSVFSISRAIAVAASLILIIGAGFWTSSLFNQQERMFAQHFEPFPNVVTIRGDQQISPELKNGMAHYSDRSWEMAEQDLKAVLELEPKNMTASFYLGISYLANDRTERAISLLEPVNADTNGLFQSHARWYLALAHLKLKDDQAKVLLSQIADGNDPDYGQKAAELMEELN